MELSRKTVDEWCERGILSLVLGMLVFAPLAFGAVYAWSFLVVQALALGVFGLWALRLWISPNPKLLWPPLAWVALAFVVYAIVRYRMADIEYVARLEMIQVLIFAFLFFAVINNLHGQNETSIVTYTLLAVGTGISGYAVAQMTHHSNHVWNEITPYMGRATGTYISPNNLAGLLAVLLPLALAFMLVGKVKAIPRILLGYGAIVMAVALAVSFSRGGWVAAACGILLLLGILVGHRNHRLKAIILLACMLAGGSVFVSHYLSKTVGYMQRVASPNGMASPTVVVEASLDSRLAMWNAALQMWEDHPWLGVGPAHFDYRFREYRPELIQARPDRAHNDYLNLLADWGAIGGMIVLAGMMVFIFSLAKTWRYVRRSQTAFTSGQSNRFAFFIGASCGLAALAVHSTVDFNLHIPANALVGVILLGLLTSNVRFATERFWFRASLPLRIFLTSILLGLSYYLTIQGLHRFGEEQWLAFAAKQPNFSSPKASALEKAFAIEPQNFETAYEIGECYRTQSFNGESDFAKPADMALDWYAKAIHLNHYDGYSYLRTGMCLDWLGRLDQARPYYNIAESLDPNGYYMIANLGWHFVQIGDYPAAQDCFMRSLKLDSSQNQIARNYLSICETKLADKASGRPQLPANLPANY